MGTGREAGVPQDSGWVPASTLCRSSTRSRSTTGCPGCCC